LGKALDLDTEQVDRLAKVMSHFEWVDTKDSIDRQIREAGFDATHPTLRLFADLWRRIQHLPRHLGQHSGGMVICQGRLDEVVPLENASMPGRVVVQWDKDDCADLGIVKVDLLGLGMMAVLQDALETINGAQSAAPAARAEGESASPEARASGGGAPRAVKMMAVLQDSLEIINGARLATPERIGERARGAERGEGAPASDALGGVQGRPRAATPLLARRSPVFSLPRVAPARSCLARSRLSPLSGGTAHRD